MLFFSGNSTPVDAASQQKILNVFNGDGSQIYAYLKGQLSVDEEGNPLPDGQNQLGLSESNLQKFLAITILAGNDNGKIISSVANDPSLSAEFFAQAGKQQSS